MLEEYRELPAADSLFVPAHPVTAAGVRPVECIEPDVRITEPLTAAVSDLSNVVYDLLLQVIVRYFAFGEESDQELDVLAASAVLLMGGVVKPLGLLLARLPVGEHPAPRPEPTSSWPTGRTS